MTEPRLPKPGEFVRHIGRLIKVETVAPPPPPKPVEDYIFEDVDAVCEMRLNGETIKIIQTLTDFYGLGTGVETAIKDMREYSEEKGLGPDIEVEIVVVRVVSQCRFRPLDRENVYDKNYVDFKARDYGSEWDVPDPVKTIVWSSKDPDAKEHPDE